METEKIDDILSLHGLWLNGEEGGVRADLRGADLSRANLSWANLSGADLREADLRGANLREANLSWADLRGANLSGADLREANLSGANLRGANLREANLSWADLSRAILREANLREANLSGADLREANLRGANLREANLSWADLSRAILREANLREANLREANLSGAKNLLLAREWLGLFEADELGIIVYRAQQGENTHPAGWEFKPGAFLTEIPNPDRCTLCACGVAFATLAWVRKNYLSQNTIIWRCRIHWMDLADVVVPYSTDGKARCARLELLEVVS